MNQERKLSKSLPCLGVLYMIISEFHNIIYRPVSKYLEMTEGNWEQPSLPPLLLLLLLSLVFS